MRQQTKNLRKAVQQIEDARKIKKELWIMACKYDNIPENSMFVVFSDDNPYIKELNSIKSDAEYLRIL